MYCIVSFDNCIDPKTGASADSNSDSGLHIPIIAGAAAGAVLLIIVLFCVVFLCWKWRSRKKKDYHISAVHSNTVAHYADKKGSTLYIHAYTLVMFKL